MSKLGVLQIIDSLDTGGAEVLSVNIANLLSKNGVKSYVCATRKEGKLKNDICKNVKYLFLEKKFTIDLSAIYRLNKFIKKNNITIIHVHGSSYFIGVLVKLTNPKLRLIWHNHYGKIVTLKGYRLFALKVSSLFFDKIINVSSKLESWSQKKLFTKNNVFLRNYPFFKKQKNTTFLKGFEGKRIVHLAGLRPDKDHITLINAFKKFSSIYSDWSLHLIGKNFNDNYSNNVFNLINKLNLINKVYYYSSCLDIKNILNQASIGVMSSVSEGLPLALLEYGLAKLPVITTDVGECNKVIKNNISGFLVPVSDSILLSNKLCKLAKSKDLRIKMGIENYRNITENFSEDLFLKKLLTLYDIKFDKENTK
ncbi:glycosyltransferase family 4 protein [Polaribacter batillariae]|uniref:Glycosyltransferase family 4 protein n=1 Tax=Polaribacter batillariae TaxID=2808900 RepID=A0ABX7SXL6_9FLAO|nr:glycosyltransferase family 4 protein [Polaribacter batillariae]QTD37574.1 glycosyltransferase family 4 protein [Polaribacter batillariae]